jgi:hypothetical protein
MIDEKESITATILRADPGWLVGFFIESGEWEGKRVEACLFYEPIIAWEIRREVGRLAPRPGRRSETFVNHEVIPITLNGNLDSQANEWVIKRPDGIFEDVGNCTWETEEDALKGIQAQRERFKALRAKWLAKEEAKKAAVS